MNIEERLDSAMWRYHMLGAKGDDRTHDWLVLERDRAALLDALTQTETERDAWKLDSEIEHKAAMIAEKMADEAIALADAAVAHLRAVLPSTYASPSPVGRAYAFLALLTPKEGQ